MKKLFQIFTAAVLLTSPLHAQFTTVGSVTITPSPSGSGRTYTLTQATPCTGALVSSAVWSNTTVNFGQSFDLYFSGRFTVPASVTGADGFCAVFGSKINTASSLNVGGGRMGYYNGGTTNPDFDNSIAIEVDIFNNATVVNDPTSPYEDHIMGTKNGDPFSLISLSTAAVRADLGTNNIKDGVYRSYQIKWDCQAQILSVYCAGSLRFSTAFNPASVFTNINSVPWGFTSATGSYCSTTDIDNPHIVTGSTCAQTPPPCDFSIEATIEQEKCNITVDIPAGQIPAGFILVGYEVRWGDGNKDIYTTATPPPYTHTYTSSGSWNVEVEAIVIIPETGNCCRSIPFTQWVDVVCSDADGIMRKSLGMETDKEAYFELASKSGIEVYPNPSQGNVNVSSRSNINSLRVYDLSGKEVYSADYENASNVIIDTKALVNGVYIIKMLDEKGNINKVKFELKK